MRWPVKEVYITQYFGVNRDKYQKFGLIGHNGIDLRASKDTPVFAAIDGKIKLYEDTDGYGKHIKQRNSDFEVVYAHLNAFAYQGSKFIKAGELLGWSGNTGFSSGPHTHFGVRALGLFGRVKNYNNGFKGWLNPSFFLEGMTQKEKILQKIYKCFRLKHLADKTALIFLPQRHGEVYLIKGDKRIKVKGQQKLIEALLALHAVGVSNKDADMIPDGGKL